ncbi:mannose-1-phosphate guanylyltransferase [uncultured Duncaniella sp.]|uniref:mannose-1-phosphate guanylyltransferase n=1 Tax=uncultured Duncaniella sp. TaxID=2768039 RepID=UPI0026772124|nr:mannose-1-phosphate guanylyltransferase [uncultured Duncaniella sp.]MCI9172079.1 mannose-1-phosphate guanylyltransferase [Muribaculaceae bacterium]
MNSHRYCVIMCGGVGSRFWPYSREDRPKQFIDFLGTGRSLLQMSYDRILPLVPKENIVVVTNEKYASLIREQLPDVLPHNILLEPARRNTAPCIAWAAYHIAALDPQASMIVAPSDHLITGDAIYCECVERGFEFVENNDALLTLGITPVRPETGYGYIQVGAPVGHDINKVKTFTEKPNLELAKVFLDSGEFLWNAGIFIWRASVIIEALRKYDSDLTVLFDKGEGLFGTANETEFIKQNFEACPANSIDYAVMEKADNVYVESARFGWNDLGTWGALYDNSPKDDNDNVSQGAGLVAYESERNIFVTPAGKLVVAHGLKDYIVADAGDVLLICPKSEEQRIKQMVNDVKIRFDEKYL